MLSPEDSAVWLYDDIVLYTHISSFIETENVSVLIKNMRKLQNDRV